MARQAQPSNDDFDRLNPSEDDLHVNSMLATEKALEALAVFEELCRVSEDAVFEADDSEITNFLKYVWFISSEIEKLNQATQIEQIEEVLGKTLGWVQLDPSNRSRWLQVANFALNQYQNTEETVRRRWASSGTSIRSSRMLEQIVQNAIADLEGIETPQGTIEAIEFIISNNRLQQILQLPEAPKRKVYTKRRRNRSEINVPTGRLLIDWLQGVSLIQISEIYLSNVDDIDFRFEQLGDFIYSRFEVFLPWVFGTIINWINELLLQNSSASLLPASLPANIRYGVNNPIALELMVRGVQSRHLALKISESWQLQQEESEVISWIRSLSLTQWIDLFDASPNEVRNLLEISRTERGGVVVDLFNTGRAKLNIITEREEYPPTEVTLKRLEESELSPVGVWDGKDLVGTVSSRDQSDIVSLMNTGISFSLEYSVSSNSGLLNLTLIEPE